MFPAEFVAYIFANIRHFGYGSRRGFIATGKWVSCMIYCAILYFKTKFFYISSREDVLFSKHAKQGLKYNQRRITGIRGRIYRSLHHLSPISTSACSRQVL